MRRNTCSSIHGILIPIGEHFAKRFVIIFAQTTLGGIEDLAKRKEDVRVAIGLPASYEIQCPPQQAVVKERTPAPHTPPPTGTDSDSNGEIQWERGEEEHIYRPPKLRPKVR